MSRNGEDALKRSVAIQAVGVALVLVVVKGAVGFLTHSMGILASALDSLMDVFSTLVNYLSIRTAAKPADQDHRYGHGKAESLAAFFQCMVLFASVGYLVKESVERLLEGARVDRIEWGLAVMLQSARPGDIVQFRNYRFVRETTIVVRNAQNQVIEEGNEVEEATRPHHTAIIQSVSQTGEIVVYEQNADGVRSVASNPLYLLSRRLPAQTTRSGGNSETRTTNITVSGTYRIFRPQPRE